MRDADHHGTGPRTPFEAVSEKRRLAMRERDRRAEGRERDSGPVNFVSENDDGLLPPNYHQATNPFAT